MLTARSLQTALLGVKCAYWKALPWTLIGLAQLDEERARQSGQLSLDQFAKAPSAPPAQHRITWKLLQPGAPFRIELEKFVGGASRWSLASHFQEQVAAFFFVPVVETTIEEKHSRVSQENRRHHIGPVM
eukprot:1203190-Pyramimonas_sp.AAC.1